MRRPPLLATWAAFALATCGLRPSFAFPGTELAPQAPEANATPDVADPRDAYDVLAYRLDVRVEPLDQSLSATVAIEARVLLDTLDALVLDLGAELEVKEVLALPRVFNVHSLLLGDPLAFEHEGDRLVCTLAEPARRADHVRVAVTYTGKPRARDNFTGFHWKTTADGRPWIGTSFQMIGAHHWFPCKASFFNPEDKPRSVIVNLDVPKGLVGVSNGRLVERVPADDREVFRWLHEYPIATYSITLNVAPYVSFSQPLMIPGLIGAHEYVAYVLPENEEKARLQFRQVPQMIRIFSDVFGPYPFERSKFALVETSFWGMEHSTAVAYGSSYPAWCEANGKPDPYASRNKFFDYILIHESAHEWWGNAVSAAAWGDFWIQEGFATYAEGIYVEWTAGRDAAARYFDSQRASIGRHSRLYAGDDVANAKEAYSTTIYAKGAWVLHTLRHYVANDTQWWSVLRSFFENNRYESVSTKDFQRTLQRVTRADWSRFFDEWVYGEGYPQLTGTVEAEGARIRIRIDNEGSGSNGFRVPLDLAWNEAGRPLLERVWLEPGKNELELEREVEVDGLELVGLERVLGKHDVTVR